MPVGCTQCGAGTVWDDDVGSSVCTSCGSLDDPSQSVLTSATYIGQNLTTEVSLWDPSAPTTLKSLRAGNNWDLSGQGKESRDRKNAYAMADFIKSLAVSFNAPGLSPRAITLFNQARTATNFRWGKKSRSVAAACLAIALRESNRPDSLRDIASTLTIPSASVTREFTSITSTLGLSLTLVDPSVHIPTLQAHLASALAEHQRESGLSPSLIKSLGPVCLRSVANIANSLSHLLARLSPDHGVLRLPVPPTACAIFILSLEAEKRAVLNPLGDLSQFLGACCHTAKSVVMTRYKTIQDEVVFWVENVPWLDKYKIKKGRANVSKRLIAARGLKDVIQFQEEIWQQRFKPQLNLELTEDESKDDDSNHVLPVVPSRPQKRPYPNHAIAQATSFLLNPLGTLVSPTSRPSSLNESPSISLATYLLTTPSTMNRRPPTRLQLLAMDRGGSSEDQISDEDLFAEGEFEKLFRSEDEVHILRQTFGWPEGGDAEDDCYNEAEKTHRRAKRKYVDASEEANGEDGIARDLASQTRKKSRLNLEALAQLLASEGTAGAEDLTDDEVDGSLQMMALYEAVEHDDYEEVGGIDEKATLRIHGLAPAPDHRSTSNAHHMANDVASDIDEEVVLENWRPSTPDHGAAFSDSRYEEEPPS